MDRKRILSDVPETGLSKTVERSPLIDSRRLRSCKSSPASRSLCRSAYQDYKTMQKVSSSKPAAQSLKTISELRPKEQFSQRALNRSRSAPQSLQSPLYSPSPRYLRSPQYRVNPMVKFDDKLFPERMNYGIAGYNTSRARSFSTIPESKCLQTPPTTRPRSFSSIPESSKSLQTKAGTRPRSFSTIPETRSVQTRRTRCPLWRLWTRRFRDKMTRTRVHDTCSKLLSRFRGSF